jgi:tetratricopeptide (TPR) repeat protein
MRKIDFILTILAFASLSFGQSDTKVLDAFGAYENGRYTEAAQFFHELAEEQYTKRPKYQYFKGLACYHSGDYATAKTELEKASDASYENADLWLAKIYAVNEDVSGALHYLNKYLESEGVVDITAIKKDSLFRILHGTNEWFMLWQEDNISSGQLAFSDAKYHLDRKQYSSAHRIMDDHVFEGEASAEIYALNSEVYSEEGIQQLAIDEINKALKIDERNTGYMVMKASYLAKSDRINDAIDILSSVLEISPEDFATRYERAELAYTNEDYDLARSDLEILTRYFERAEYDFLMGKTYYESGNYVSALKTFNRIMEREKPKAKYYKARGMTYYKTRIFDQAAYDLSMSLDLSPNDPETNFYLGLAEQNRGNNKMACYYLLRAKNYGNIEAEKFIEKYCK